MLIETHLLFIRSVHHGSESGASLEYGLFGRRRRRLSIAHPKLVQRGAEVRLGRKMVGQNGTLFASEYHANASSELLSGLARN